MLDTGIRMGNSDPIIREADGSPVGSNGHAQRVTADKPKYYLDGSESALDVCRRSFPDGEKFYQGFTRDLQVLLTRGVNNVYKWFHQPFATPYGPSGEQRWIDIVDAGHTQEQPYLLPTLEARLINQLQGFFQQAFAPLHPFGLMAGPGTEWAVKTKEIRTLEPSQASGAAAWDLMPQFAERGARQVQAALHIPTYAIANDFALPLSGLDDVLGKQPVLITMYGCTLGNDINLTHVPKNFAATIQRKGFLFVTIDGAEDQAAVEGYRNDLYTAFQQAYWEIAKFMTNDKSFNPKAIKCDPYYERKFDPPHSYRATIHRHTVVENTKLMGYPLKAGTQLFLGRSHKWKPEDIQKPFDDVGMRQLAYFQEGTICAVLFAGVDTPKKWMKPVETALRNAQSNNLGNVTIVPNPT